MTEALVRGDGARIIDKTAGNYLIQYPHGDTELKNRNPTNELLFEEGMYDFLRGDEATIQVLKPSSSGEYIAISPTSEDNVFTIWCGDADHPVITDPEDSYEVLDALREALNENYSKIRAQYSKVFDEQARSNVINKLLGYFPEVEATEHGWKIDDAFLVTWKGEVYQSAEDIEEDSLVRNGSRVVEAGSREAINLKTHISPEDIDDNGFLNLEGVDISLSEREVKFIAKVAWLIERRKHLQDDAFWNQYNE
jgi:hypothetical protein